MSEQDQKAVTAAIQYIKSKIAELIQGVKCEDIYDPRRMVYKIEVSLSGENLPITELIFSRENMEDFSTDDTNYGIRFRYYIDFKIYIALIKANLLPSFRISKIFIQEAANRRKDDWWNDRYVRVAFDNKITAVLTVSLKKLKETLERTFSENEAEVDLSELKEALDVIKSILDYYNLHKSLDETAASIKSLSILKAAAIYEIAESEKKRDSSNRPYQTGKINDKICWIADFLRKGAFLEVRLPDWLVDYVST